MISDLLRKRREYDPERDGNMYEWLRLEAKRLHAVAGMDREQPTVRVPHFKPVGIATTLNGVNHRKSSGTVLQSNESSFESAGEYAVEISKARKL